MRREDPARGEQGGCRLPIAVMAHRKACGPRIAARSANSTQDEGQNRTIRGGPGARIRIRPPRERFLTGYVIPQMNSQIPQESGAWIGAILRFCSALPFENGLVHIAFLGGTMAKKTLALASVAALSLTLGLAGCTQPEDGDDAKPTTETTEKAPESTEPTTEATDEAEETEEAEPEESEEATDAPSTEGTTAPGTKLALGDTATLPWSALSDSTPQPMDVTVTGITQGKIEDFAPAGADFQAQLEGMNTYYISVEVTKADLSAEALANQAFYSDMSAVDADGKRLSTVSMIGDFAPCNTSSLDKSIDEGTPQTFCYIVAGPASGDIGGATYRPNDGEYADDLVTWEK